MYGPQQLLPALPKPCLLPQAPIVIKRGGCEMTIVKRLDTIELHVKIVSGGGVMYEDLILVKRPGDDNKDWWFRLHSRRTDAKIPIIEVVKRHNEYPVGKIVKL